MKSHIPSLKAADRGKRWPDRTMFSRVQVEAGFERILRDGTMVTPLVFGLRSWDFGFDLCALYFELCGEPECPVVSRPSTSGHRNDFKVPSTKYKVQISDLSIYLRLIA